jgi:hypothetical protein
MQVVSLLAIDVVREDRHHVLVSVGVKVMDLVPLVEDVCHHLRRWGVHYCGTDDIRHVSVILIFCEAMFLVAEELADGAKMDIAS